MASIIETERLRLELLSIEFLRFVAAGDLERAKGLVSFGIPFGCSMAGKPWVSRRVDLILRDRAQHPWMYRAIVRNHDNNMVGFISFHHKFPDPDLAAFSRNGVELGYTIEAEARRMGYARESILGAIRWAGNEEKTAEIFVTISPGNGPSMMLAESMGFIKVGEHQDEVDGLEYVMKYPLRGLPLGVAAVG